MDRLRVEQGIEVRLIPDAEVIDSGVDHVVTRQKEGWSYIRV
jgi:intracellular sulfur oxidation DsrE/DsrF family protein